MPNPSSEMRRSQNPSEIRWSVCNIFYSLVFLNIPIAAPAFATLTWTGTAGDGKWTTAGNWSPAQVPTSADEVSIDQTAAVSVPAGSSGIAFNSLALGDAAGSTSPTLIISTSVSTGGGVTIFRSATLQQDTNLQLTFGSVNVSSGGTLTHTANTNTRSFLLNLNVTGDFNLQAGSSIAVDGRGYGRQGFGGGPGPGGGGVGFNTVNGNGSGGGGGHGGAGGKGMQFIGGSQGGVVNDSLTFPTDLGSGGGAAPFCDGGPGGGAVILLVGGNLTINGVVSANGSSGNGGCGSGGGGGAGGTINITAANLTGSGSLRANGGAGGSGPNFAGGGGGGGRVAIVAAGSDSSGFNIAASNGSGGVSSENGGAGTIAIKTPGGINYSLTIGDLTRIPQSSTTISGASLTFSTATLNNSIVMFDPNSTISIANLVVAGNAAMTANNLVLTSNATVKNGGVLFLTANSVIGSNITMDVGGGGLLQLAAGSISGISLLVEANAVFQQMNAALLNFGSVNVLPGGVLTHAPNATGRQAVLNLNVSGDFNLQAGSSIAVDGRGYGASSGPGAGGVGFNTVDGNGSGGGGGHGGAGGPGVIIHGGSRGGVINDILSYPTDLGSGGGSSPFCIGGPGGGALILVVGGNLTLNGLVSANGLRGASTCDSGGGGGAGGTINITATNVTGPAILRANGAPGGSGTNFAGGGGGGGRIALFYSNKTGSINYSANGATGVNNGADGTIFDNFLIIGSLPTGPNLANSSLQQNITTAQGLTETVGVQTLNFAGVPLAGGTPGAFQMAQINLVTVQAGSFAGQGFFRGMWSLSLASGGTVSGVWAGTVALTQLPRQLILKGAMDGGIRGALEGTLSETSLGSGIFNQIAVTLSAVRVGTTVGTVSSPINGTGSLGQSAQYPGTPLSLSQASLTGQASGFYAGALQTSYTLIRVNSPGNLYDGQGFFLPTYSFRLGNGVGWAFASTSGNTVALAGLFDQPLRGLMEGSLTLGSSPSASFSLEQLAAGLPPAPQLHIELVGPGAMNAGDTDSFSILLRNDGYASSPIVSLIAEATQWTDFVSASGNYREYNVASWWNGQLFAPRPFIRWDVQIPARSSISLDYQVRVRNPVAGGPAAHDPLDKPNVHIITPAQAEQFFASYQRGTP